MALDVEEEQGECLGTDLRKNSNKDSMVEVLFWRTRCHGRNVYLLKEYKCKNGLKMEVKVDLLEKIVLLAHSYSNDQRCFLSS